MKDGESKVELRRAGAQGQQSLERFNGHVLRVSGAQFFARCLIPLPTIMLLGRWGVCAGGSIRDQHIRKWLRPWPCCGPVRGAPQPVAVGGSSMPSYDKITENLERLSARIEALQARPPLVVRKLAHARNPSEVDKLPIHWTTACGCWRYGCEDHAATRCRRCFSKGVEEAQNDTSDISASESSKSATSSESASEG